MEYREATDRLTAPPASYPLRRLAERLRVTLNTVNRARMTDSAHARNPPPGWVAAVAEEAEIHADELERKAADLRQLAAELLRKV